MTVHGRLRRVAPFTPQRTAAAACERKVPRAAFTPRCENCRLVDHSPRSSFHSFHESNVSLLHRLLRVQYDSQNSAPMQPCSWSASFSAWVTLNFSLPATCLSHQRTTVCCRLSANPADAGILPLCPPSCNLAESNANRVTACGCIQHVA